MTTTKELNIKNKTYHFWNDLINLKDFNPELLKLDKKESININIYYIGYVTKKPDYNIDSINPLYLLIDKLDGFMEEKMVVNIYIVVNNGSIGEYGKNYAKIKFDSDDDLPLNKILKFHVLTIIIRNVFEKHEKYYPQIFLDDCLYEI